MDGMLDGHCSVVVVGCKQIVDDIRRLRLVVRMI